MRAFLILLPALALAQTPPATTPAAPAKKAPAAATAPAKKSPATTTTPAGTAAPKPPATGSTGAGRGAAGRGATAPKAAAAPAPLTTDDQKTVYALGLSIGKSLAMFSLTPEELEIVKRALSDSAAGKEPAIDLSEWGPKIEPLARTRGAAVAEKEKAASVAYLAKCAAEPGAVKTASGIVYKEVRVGTGESPKATDTVKVNYRGTLVNGTEFDSSYKRNEPAQFPLNGVIRCWTEGVQRMKVGGKSTLVCPSDLAYGDQGRPSIPGGATLIFDIELLEIVGAK